MDKKMLYVVLPCYNEEYNIGSLIEAWKAEEHALHDKDFYLELIVVDDGSTDNTLNVVKSKALLYNNITLLVHKTNSGLGEVINTGINYALSLGKSSLLCIMDGDMTHEPKYIHSMMDKLLAEELHCVIASRYQKASRVEGLALYRKLLSCCARMLYTLRFGIPNVRDFTCGYRLYKIEGLKIVSERYGGQIVSQQGFACMTELLVKLGKENLRIGEIPFVLKYQLKEGKSKLKIFKTILGSLLMMAKL